MTEHHFRLRSRDVDLEIQGERDFVEAALARFGHFAISQARDPRDPVVKDDCALQAAESGPRPIRVRKNISFGDFLELKGPESSLDRLLTLAYFLEKYEARPAYALAELDEEWSHAFPGDAFKPDIWRDAVGRGYLEDHEGRLTLTFSGEAYVQNGLADPFRPRF